MHNPRWPYTFVIVGESLDSHGMPVTDENGDPVTTTPSVEMVSYDPRMNPARNIDGSIKTQSVTTVPWGYRTSTGGMKVSGEVWVADYKISCPMLLTDIPSGTTLILTDAVRSFRVKVVKMTTYNWGTNLWVDNIKN